MADNELKQLDLGTREAFAYVFEIMDNLSGGALKRGYREATPAERIKEWDALTPEQHTQLQSNMGDEWVMKQGAEIERLRKQVIV